jgi:two-component sensor histidine kinase
MHSDAIENRSGELPATEQYRLLAEEADHRLLNNLQAIASMLAVYRKQYRSHELDAPFVSISQRVMALQRIHGALRSTEKLSCVEIRALISDICSGYATAFAAEKGPDFSIRTEGDEILLRAADANALATAANELLMNAIKHGEGSIRVDLRMGQSSYIVSVASEGGRLESGFRIHRSKGLGLRIVTSLVQKLGGTFDVKLNSEGVPCFRIIIPVEDGRPTEFKLGAGFWSSKP